jgi:phosphatidate cytidylyltransferase
MKNFASRILINLFGIPLILFSIQVGTYFFTALVTLIVLIAQFEFIKIQNLNKFKLFTVPLSILTISWFLTALYLPQFLLPIFIICILILVLLSLFNSIATAIDFITKTVFAFVYFTVFSSAMIVLREHFLVEAIDARRLLTTMFVAIWICDSLAFVFGKWLGKKRIAPQISPNKTVVGSLAGIFGACLTVFVFYLLEWTPSFFSLFELGVFALIIGVFGQFGDLFESLIKRNAGVKDSGKILLGHGGILDRFDSVFFSSACTFLFVYFTQFL